MTFIVEFVKSEFSMEYIKDIFVHPHFDFTKFLQDGFLSDVSLKFPDGQVIHAHKMVLVNCSYFFSDCFSDTSSFGESKTGIVEIKIGSYSHLHKLITFIYSGKINCEPDEILPLLSLAHYYRIPKLKEKLSEEIRKRIENSDDPSGQIISFYKQCQTYGDEFEDALDSYMSSLDDITSEFIISLQKPGSKLKPEKFINDISNYMTCTRFAMIIGILHDKYKKNDGSLIKWTDIFYGDYEGDESEKKDITSSLSKIFPINQLVSHKWFLPP